MSNGDRARENVSAWELVAVNLLMADLRSLDFTDDDSSFGFIDAFSSTLLISALFLCCWCFADFKLGLVECVASAVDDNGGDADDEDDED